MKLGIIRSDEGYEILVDGQRRSFRDDKATAYEAALFLKMVGKGKEKVEIVDRRLVSASRCLRTSAPSSFAKEGRAYLSGKRGRSDCLPAHAVGAGWFEPCLAHPH